jgi:predicted nuclease with TOPRIM domain
MHFQNFLQMRRERDEAREDLDNMQDQRDLAMKLIKRLEQERDEARTELAQLKEGEK